MQHLDADPEALSGDGQGLAQCTAGAGPGGGCAPAGADPISAAVAGSFSAWEAGLEALVAHSQAVRVTGGLAVAHTAAVLEATDQAGGATIASLVATPAAAPDATPPGGQVPAPPALPVAPAVPAVPEPVSGQAWSAQIHAGAGPTPLVAYASRMRGTSAELTAVAEQLRSHAHAIDAHWDDGIQRAGANVARLADWFDDTAAYARDVAAAAEHSADHVRDAVSGTPRPETFAQLQARVNDGLARFSRSGGLDVVPLQQATTDMAEAQRNAIDAQVAYAAAANTTTAEVPRPPKPAPPIVGGPSTTGGDTDESSPASEDKTDTDGDTDGDADGAKAKKTGGEADEGAEDGADNDAAAGADDLALEGTPDPDLGSAADPEPAGAQDPPRPAVDPNVLSAPAGTTGTTAGQILSGLTQAAGGMSPGMAGGGTSPMSALSGLSGLPGSFGGGMSGTPDMSAPDAHDHDMFPSDDLGLDGSPMDFAAGDTTASGGGDMGASLPSGTTAALPAAAPASPAIGALPGPASGAPTPGGGAMMGGGGMYPPMAGAGQGAQSGERDKALHPDKRVVHREVANTEPVFGELERDRRRSPRQRPTQDQEETAHGTTTG